MQIYWFAGVDEIDKNVADFTKNNYDILSINEMASIYPTMLFSYACGFLDAEIQTDFYLHSFEL